MKADSVAGKREGRATDAGDDVKIDKDLAALIPALSKDEYAQLEQSLLKALTKPSLACNLRLGK